MTYLGYILHSLTDGSYYLGQTRDLPHRVHEHNCGRVSSTRRGMPWELVYWREFPNRSEAVKWERMLKARKSRAYIEALLSEQAL